MDSAVWFDQGFHSEVVLFALCHKKASPVFPHRHCGNLRVTGKIPLQQLAKHAFQTCRAYLCSLTLEHIFPVFIFSF